MHQEKVHQEKLKAIKAHLNFEEVSQHSELGTLSKRRDLRERLRSKYVRNVSKAPNQGAADLNHQGREVQNERSRRDTERCYQSFRSRGTKSASKKNNNKRESSRRTKVLSEGEGGSQDQKCKIQVLRTMICPNHRELPLTEKCIKDPVEIHNIKHRDGESMEEFVRRYKLECKDVKGAPECMKISGFMHEIINPELIKRLHDKISKSVDEMMRVTTSFLKGEVVASSRERKKSFPSWKQQEAGQKQNFKKGGSWNQHRSEQKQDMFTLLTKTPKEILALDKGKFKPPPSMTTPIEKRNTRKFYEFHVEVGHATDETKAKQWERPCKEGRKLSKGQAAGNPDGTAMEKGSQTKDHPNILSRDSDLIPTPRGGGWTEGPMIIEAEMRRHFVHRMYVDEGSSSENLYDHCFNRFRPKARIQMIPAATPLVRFSGEIIWPLTQISLLVKIGNEEHSTFAWMNFMVARSPSPYNRIIGSLGVWRIHAVPSTAHEMLKFPVTGGTITLWSSMIIPLECIMVLGPRTQQPVIDQVTEEKIQRAIHPEYSKQTIAIGSTLT
nr:reverse transcriptase domain-containing protein [Tanacetum cinerariifolium]